MFEDRNLFLFANFVEIVHVELTYKGRELFMFEIFWEDLVLEEILMLHNKASSVVCPLNDMTVPLIFQYLVCLHDKVRNILLLMNPFPTWNL